MTLGDPVGEFAAFPVNNPLPGALDDRIYSVDTIHSLPQMEVLDSTQAAKVASLFSFQSVSALKSVIAVSPPVESPTRTGQETNRLEGK